MVFDLSLLVADWFPQITCRRHKVFTMMYYEQKNYLKKWYKPAFLFLNGPEYLKTEQNGRPNLQNGPPLKN